MTARLALNTSVLLRIRASGCQATLLRSPHKHLALSCSSRAGAHTASTSEASKLVHLLRTGFRATAVAHEVWRQVLRPGDVAVDATTGNGADTLALARMVGPDGVVHGIDVQVCRARCAAMRRAVPRAVSRGEPRRLQTAAVPQEQALAATRRLLDEEPATQAAGTVHLHLGCHSKLREFLASTAGTTDQPPPRLICFNLGWLPGGSKEVITRTATTLAALNAATDVLATEGLISVAAYVGHEGGPEEHAAVRQWMMSLSPSQWHAIEHTVMNKALSPKLLWLYKRS